MVPVIGQKEEKEEDPIPILSDMLLVNKRDR